MKTCLRRVFCESTESDGHRVEHGPGPDNVFSSAGVKTTFCELLLGAATFPTSVGRRARSLIRVMLPQRLHANRVLLQGQDEEGGPGSRIASIKQHPGVCFLMIAYSC